jgi:hypothetical protein
VDLGRTEAALIVGVSLRQIYAVERTRRTNIGTRGRACLNGGEQLARALLSEG